MGEDFLYSITSAEVIEEAISGLDNDDPFIQVSLGLTDEQKILLETISVEHERTSIYFALEHDAQVPDIVRKFTAKQYIADGVSTHYLISGDFIDFTTQIQNQLLYISDKNNVEPVAVWIANLANNVKLATHKPNLFMTITATNEAGGADAHLHVDRSYSALSEPTYRALVTLKRTFNYIL